MAKSAATNLSIIMTGVDQLARSLTPPSEFLSDDTERRIMRIREAVAHALGCDPFADYADDHAN